MKQNMIIVQARMASTRLPGKVLLKVLDKPLLGYLVERLSHVKNAARVCIATSLSDADTPIVEFCGAHSLGCFRGPEEDVLARYYLAAKAAGTRYITRVTADCPLSYPQVIARVIAEAMNHPAYDYVSNCLERSYPIGMD